MCKCFWYSVKFRLILTFSSNFFKLRLKKRQATSKILLKERNGVDIDPSTAWRPVRKPLPSAVNVQKRMEWARVHKDWTIAFWSDESAYELFGS